MKKGTITFRQGDDDSVFLYSYEISNFHAAKILEYISRIPNKKSVPFRDSDGKFISPTDTREYKRLLMQRKSIKEGLWVK